MEECILEKDGVATNTCWGEKWNKWKIICLKKVGREQRMECRENYLKIAYYLDLLKT